MIRGGYNKGQIDYISFYLLDECLRGKCRRVFYDKNQRQVFYSNNVLFYFEKNGDEKSLKIRGLEKNLDKVESAIPKNSNKTQ